MRLYQRAIAENIPIQGLHTILSKIPTQILEGLDLRDARSMRRVLAALEQNLQIENPDHNNPNLPSNLTPPERTATLWILSTISSTIGHSLLLEGVVLFLNTGRGSDTEVTRAASQLQNLAAPPVYEQPFTHHTLYHEAVARFRRIYPMGVPPAVHGQNLKRAAPGAFVLPTPLPPAAISEPQSESESLAGGSYYNSMEKQLEDPNIAKARALRNGNATEYRVIQGRELFRCMDCQRWKGLSKYPDKVKIEKRGLYCVSCHVLSQFHRR